MESKLDDVAFEFKDSDSHIYECPDDIFPQSASKSSDFGNYSEQKPSSGNGSNGLQSSQGYNVPRGTGTDKKQLNRMDVLTKTRAVGNTYEDAAETRLEGKGSTASGGVVANNSCRTSGFLPGQKNAADGHGWRDESHEEDQYIEMNPIS